MAKSIRTRKQQSTQLTQRGNAPTAGTATAAAATTVPLDQPAPNSVSSSFAHQNPLVLTMLLVMWTVIHFAQSVGATLPSAAGAAGSTGAGSISTAFFGALPGVAFVGLACWAAIAYGGNYFAGGAHPLPSYAPAATSTATSKLPVQRPFGAQQNNAEYEQLRHAGSFTSTIIPAGEPNYDFTAPTAPAKTAAKAKAKAKAKGKGKASSGSSTTTTTTTTDNAPCNLHTPTQAWPSLADALDNEGVGGDSAGWGDFASASAGIDWECVRRASQEARRQRSLTGNSNSLSSEKEL